MGCGWSARIKADVDEDHLHNNQIQSPLQLQYDGTASLKSFTYNDLKIATNKFCPKSVIRGGTFDCVYKGYIHDHTFAPSSPDSGFLIAVKKIHQQGISDTGHKQWLDEVNYLGQVLHPNLLKLIGYCSEDKHRLLVYEFMLQGSLDTHLFKKPSYFEPLSWRIRMKIALGAAKGLAFLHNPQINVIYQDFKPSNILLDSDYNAKLSSFNLAKDEQSVEKTDVSTRVLGTLGYAAPEVTPTSPLTRQSDVYSFGVVLLEIMTGRRVLDSNRSPKERNLIKWAKSYFQKGEISKIMDSRIQGQYSSSTGRILGNLVSQCLSVDPRTRPSMNEAVLILERVQDTNL